MADLEIVGTLFVTLVPVIVSIVVLFKYLSDPLKELNYNIIRLNKSVEMLFDENKRQNKTLDAQHEKIDNLTVIVHEHEVRIDTLEKR